jgi:2-pyrone-4,6-dicarboxylate lactonase
MCDREQARARRGARPFETGDSQSPPRDRQCPPMSAAQTSYSPSPNKPRLAFPRGACDAHFHVIGPQATFPFSPERTYTPPHDAPKETLFALHRHLGIERGVVVQAGCHGFDNSAAEDAVTAGAGAYRGVALLRPGVPDAELRRLDRAGFRGVRFNYMKHLGAGAPFEDVLRLSQRLAPLGWHLQIHLEGELIAEMAPALKRSAVPVVIDHMGRVDAALGLEQPAFRALLALLEDERFWVKVSGPERISRRSPPYEDAIPFARKLVAEFGDRTLWGTDWPHPNLSHVPDDGVLADLLAQIAPSAAQRQGLLVDNPKRLYRF